MERKITFRQRMEMRLHTMMCGMCGRFRANIIELRKRVRGSKTRLEESQFLNVTLPPATKARLEEAVKRHFG